MAIDAKNFLVFNTYMQFEKAFDSFEDAEEFCKNYVKSNTELFIYEFKTTHSVEFLKPCPFCDCKNPRLGIDDDGRRNEYYIYCDNCGVQTMGYMSESSAANSWNLRPEPDKIGDDE